MASFFGEVVEVYRSSRKQQDIFWNVYVARPLAAALVYFLRRTPITPNQVSFLGVFVFFGSVALLVGWRDPIAMVLAALVLQFSYLFDCADGQLARLKGMTSNVGAYLDFFMDEVKALLLVAACGARLWLQFDEPIWLLAGMLGVMLVAIGTSLTNFVRRPEYAGHEIKPGASAMKKAMPQSLVGRIVWVLERIAQWIVHYPSWFLYIALLDLVPGVNGALVFLFFYLGIYVAYVGRTSLGVFVRLAHPGFYRP
ncbi:MAG: CDP-alcohol phosphatidyltransferase family protein [Bradymonadaceae bacterium]|nr:CDP-alcohol phosphatidyltransferase family protein [Lujinxingiaceae bacterium]